MCRVSKSPETRPVCFKEQFTRKNSVDAINPLQPKNMALLSIFCRLPSPFIFWKSYKLFFVAISTLSGTTVAHTLYTEEWHRLAKYCRLGKYHNLVRVVASLFSPALALGLQAAHSLRITKWKMPFLYIKQIELWSTQSNMFLV